MSQVTLSPTLDLVAAPALKQELLNAFAVGDGVAIDASQVQRIGSPCLQVIVAAILGGASLTDSSAAFDETASLLGLAATLNLKGSDVALS